MTRWRWTASPELIAEKDARRRADLPKTHPILWARCPEAQLRLFDFSIELRNRVRATHDGLQDAAEATLEAVQSELRSRSSPLELPVASELAFSRLWAIHALAVHAGSHSHAKHFELKITDGTPLAVCVGTGPWFPPVAGFRKLQRVQLRRGRTYLGDVWVPALGCHAVMPESTRLGGVMWRYWCDDCAPNKRRRLARKRAGTDGSL